MQAGADANVPTQPLGATPLFIAAQLGAADLVDLLVRANANPNLAESSGLTPMHVAANGTIVRLLYSVRGDVNAVSHNGSSPLALAQESGRLDVVRELQQLGGKSIQPAQDRRTSMILTRHGSDQVIGGGGGGSAAAFDARGMSARAPRSAPMDSSSSSSSSAFGAPSSDPMRDTNGMMISQYPFFVGMIPREQLLQSKLFFFSSGKLTADFFFC